MIKRAGIRMELIEKEGAQLQVLRIMDPFGTSHQRSNQTLGVPSSEPKG